MLVSIEESGKYFLLGEKCTSNGQLCYFHTFLLLLRLSQLVIATKISLFLECLWIGSAGQFLLLPKNFKALARQVPWKENEQRFLPSFISIFDHSTSIWVWMVCKKLTKAKLNIFVRLMLTFRRTCPEQGLHQGQRSSKLT